MHLHSAYLSILSAFLANAALGGCLPADNSSVNQNSTASVVRPSSTRVPAFRNSSSTHIPAFRNASSTHVPVLRNTRVHTSGNGNASVTPDSTGQIGFNSSFDSYECDDEDDETYEIECDEEESMKIVVGEEEDHDCDSPGPNVTSTIVNNVAGTSNVTAIANVSRFAALDGGHVAAAWYPSWQASLHPIEKLSWDKYNVMTFSFATTTADVNSPITLDADSKALLPKFVQQAKQHNVRALVSLGGWTGSMHFSTAVSTATNRAAFIKAITDLVSTYNLDGIDFDWEFPNKEGIGCNDISVDDSANFLTFLQELRQDPTGSKLVLSAAVGLSPFAGPDGQPMSDVSGFAEVFDFIAIMAYDVWGSWSASVGPNAPLEDSCAASPAGSVASSVAAWTAAGFPANQLVLGVPAYGRAFYVEATNALNAAGEVTPYVAFGKSKQPLGEGETGELIVDQCGTSSGPGGLFNFEGLVSAGYLKQDGTVADGVSYHYDTCSQTPFAYKKSENVMISYDDAKSFAAKGKYIGLKGLKGFAMWHGSGDYNDILLDAVNQAMGQ